MQEPKFKHFHELRSRLFVLVFWTDTPAGKMFDIVLLWSIVISIVVVMLESVSELKEKFEEIFYLLEWSFTILFTIEYILRISITRRPTKYMFSFLGIIDFLALLPTYISLFVAGGSYLVVIRAIRLLRIFRILKLTRYLEDSKVLAQSMSSSKRKILIFMGAVSALVIITGTLMYLIEGGENGFTSIPRSIYWAVVTVTTVGYGDIAPQTIVGQAFATLLMLAGYAIIAVPTGIVTSEMGRRERERMEEGKRCSRCMTPNSTEANYCNKCGKKLIQ